jgi:hypothetical protein
MLFSNGELDLFAASFLLVGSLNKAGTSIAPRFEYLVLPGKHPALRRKASLERK